jgi:HD-GYP domain-containing protein (c-di-GMP phosphodiesterase class II)
VIVSPDRNYHIINGFSLSAFEGKDLAKDSDNNIGKRIVTLHEQMRKVWPHLCRIAIATYDGKTDLLKTFINSTDGGKALSHYSVKLGSVKSLNELAKTRKTRVINDLEVLGISNSEHTKWLLSQGFKSSYTVPIYAHDSLVGFLFFDADETDYFSDIIVKSLSVYSELIGALLLNELAPINTLQGILNTAKHFTYQRDEETSGHIQRMSHYSHLIAMKLARTVELSDEYVEYILRYSPLHDIGKIGIPDNILLKAGPLTQEEYEVAREHVPRGIEIIDSIIDEFDLAHLTHLEILRNIINCHHERYDGSGYPKGLVGEAIPLEGRIVAIADVLDALTARRQYKWAWDFDKSVDYICENANTMFDPACVSVLDQNRAEFKEILMTFKG